MSDPVIDLLRGSLGEAASALRLRAISAVELTTAALDAAQRLNGPLNAFVRLDREAALEQAAACDARGPAEDRPLQGIPLAHKDMFDRAGRSAGCGAPRDVREPPVADATVLARLKAAGTVDLGALNMSEFAVGPTGHNVTHGACRNPWAPGHITGGSSSGSAAAVAARAVFGALGSDTGGSIRGPASCCGVTGLKPTHGAVSRAGAMPLSSSLDCVGLLARSASDCSLLFAGIAGPDPRDAACTGPAYHHQALDLATARRLKIGLPRDLWAEWAAEDIHAALANGAGEWVRAGLAGVPVQGLQRDRCHDLADIVFKAEAAAVHHESLLAKPGRYSPQVRRRLEAGRQVGASDYLRALDLRTRMRDEFLARLGDADLLLLPALVLPVPTIHGTDEEALGALPELVPRMTAMMRWINYLGLPSLSLPIGFDAAGLPVGAQLVGRTFAEADCLQAGMLFQTVTDWHTRLPRCHA